MNKEKEKKDAGTSDHENKGEKETGKRGIGEEKGR